MTEKTNADYCRTYRAKEGAKNEALGVEKVTFEVAPGTKAMVKDLIKWHDFGEAAEVIQTLVRNAHALGPGSNPMTDIPRGGFQPSAKQLRAIENEQPRRQSGCDYCGQRGCAACSGS